MTSTAGANLMSQKGRVSEDKNTDASSSSSSKPNKGKSMNQLQKMSRQRNLPME